MSYTIIVSSEERKQITNGGKTADREERKPIAESKSLQGA